MHWMMLIMPQRMEMQNATAFGLNMKCGARGVGALHHVVKARILEPVHVPQAILKIAKHYMKDGSQRQRLPARLKIAVLNHINRNTEIII